jgi:hypothetical protein
MYTHAVPGLEETAASLVISSTAPVRLKID